MRQKEGSGRANPGHFYRFFHSPQQLKDAIAPVAMSQRFRLNFSTFAALIGAVSSRP
jgi:hypothetical protein